MEDLPDYMQLCFLALYNTINEMAYDTLKEQGLNIVPYLARGVSTNSINLHLNMHDIKFRSNHQQIEQNRLTNFSFFYMNSGQICAKPFYWKQSGALIKKRQHWRHIWTTDAYQYQDLFCWFMPIFT